MLEEAGRVAASLTALSSALHRAGIVPSYSSLAAKGLLRNKWGSGKKSLFCFLPACRHRAALTQLRWRGANSCGEAGAALSQGISRPLCLLSQCSYTGLLAELRVFLSVYCAFGAQRCLGVAHGVLHHIALVYNSSPSTWSWKETRCRGTILTLKVLLF